MHYPNRNDIGDRRYHPKEKKSHKSCYSTLSGHLWVDRSQSILVEQKDVREGFLAVGN